MSIELSSDLLKRAVEVRRRIHSNPELSNQEVETTALLRRELEGAGVTRITPIGQTGLVVDIPGQEPGPVIAVRADIDALPMSEQADVPFRSRTPGVMHSCGHDVHSAMALGVALKAASLPNLSGTLRIIFQPAEENEPLGGRRVVEGGHLRDVAAAVALHVDPDAEVGQIRLGRGPTMASSDVFAITVRGQSSHAGWPQLGVDAITSASAVIQELQTMVTRRLDPRAPVALNLGRIAGGAANNVVADEVRIEGVLRSLDEDTRKRARNLLREVVEHVCRAHGARGDLELVPGEPVLENHPAVVDALAGSVEDLLGVDALHWLDSPTMNAEDFAFYAQCVPSAMAWIGVRNEAKGFTYPLHHPRFAADEGAIPLGMAVLVQAAIALLKDPPVQDTSAGDEQR